LVSPELAAFGVVLALVSLADVDVRGSIESVTPASMETEVVNVVGVNANPRQKPSGAASINKKKREDFIL